MNPESLKTIAVICSPLFAALFWWIGRLLSDRTKIVKSEIKIEGLEKTVERHEKKIEDLSNKIS